MIENLASGVTAFTSNAYLVTGERTVCIDTGANFDVVEAVTKAVADGAGAEAATESMLDAVVLTHTHPDHVANVEPFRDAFDVDTWGYDADSEWVDHGIDDGETIRIGDGAYTAIHTPGHKADHCCLYDPGSGICFTGDLVFANGGFGRTDLPEGDRDALIESITRLQRLTSDHLTTLYPGHGPSVSDDAAKAVTLSKRAATQ